MQRSSESSSAPKFKLSLKFTEFKPTTISVTVDKDKYTLGPPRLFKSLFLEGKGYSQNYAYDLKDEKGNVVSVVHLHYNTDDASEIGTATIGLEKLKESDFGKTTSYSVPKEIVDAARKLKH